MTLSDFRRITDELLSAYIDDEVTEQERALVEAALAADQEIAWRLDSLRQTVTLLRDLPELALPRSFTLTLDQVHLPQAEAQVEAEKMGVIGATELERAAMPAAPSLHRPKPTHTPPAEAGFWEQVQEGWRRFWQAGNPILRNAAAVSFALMLFVATGGQIINRALTQPLGSMASAPQAAPVAAPAAESVALVPAATEPASEVEPQGETAGKVAATEGEESAGEESADEAPAGETQANARILQSQAAPAEAEADEIETADATSPAQADASLAEAAPTNDAASDTMQDTPMEEAESATVAMAPPAPFPGGGRPQGGGGMDAPPGMGGGAGAGGDGVLPGAGGGESSLVPPEAYEFNVNPAGAPIALPAEEAVSASVAAASAEVAPAESAADMVVTPAVDAPAEEPAPQVAMAAAANEPAATELPANASARSATESTTASETAMATVPAAPTLAPVTEQKVTEVTVEPTVAPEATATPEAVAVVAPGEIASSDVIENVPVEGAVEATGPAGNLPVVWVAQGTTILLTFLLSSLWWRSRTPRRPRP